MKIIGGNIPLSEIQKRREAGELPSPIGGGGGGSIIIDEETKLKVAELEKNIKDQKEEFQETIENQQTTITNQAKAINLINSDLDVIAGVGNE